ncbi:hypothetical protein F5B21DRAFT_464047 [Xylaria acuta]|nr:hypothetical protein F5B21DRAFT_464047 [Xylaria acuta]
MRDEVLRTLLLCLLGLEPVVCGAANRMAIARVVVALEIWNIGHHLWYGVHVEVITSNYGPFRTHRLHCKF